MLRADVLVAQALGLFGGHVQDALALRAEGNFDGGGNALANGDASFNLFANGFDGTLLAEEAVGQGFVLAHQAEQQMLRLDVGAAILAGFVPCKKYDATRLLCIAFEHVSSLLPQGRPRPRQPQLRGTAERRVPAPGCGRNARRAGGCASRSGTSTYARDAAVPATRTWPKHSARPNLR